MNPICMRTANYKHHSAGACQHIQSLGIQYVEKARADDYADDIARLADCGLSVYSLQAQFPIYEDDYLDYLKRDIDAALAYGSQQLFVATDNKHISMQESYERFQNAGDLVDSAHLNIVLELHKPFVSNGAVALETMKQIDHPRVRVNWDTANIHYYNRDVDGLEELRKALPFVASLHVKDSNCAFEQWHFPALGEGSVRFPEIFSLLQDAGYQGTLTMEIEGIEGEQWSESELHTVMKQSTDYLRTFWIGQTV